MPMIYTIHIPEQENEECEGSEATALALERFYGRAFRGRDDVRPQLEGMVSGEAYALKGGVIVTLEEVAAVEPPPAPAPEPPVGDVQFEE